MSATLVPLRIGLDALRVEIAAGRPPDPSAAMRARWDGVRTRTPRLFNGPILAYEGFDGSTATVRARRETYMRLVCQDAADARGVMLLGVTGVLIAPGLDGERRVLLGRRSGEVWACPGMWEFGPAGGLGAPGIFDHDCAATLAGDDALRHLLRELREETGIVDPPASARVECITIDPTARGADIVLRIELLPPIEDFTRTDAADAWEYDDVCWLSAEELAAFADTHGAEIIAPTRLILDRLLGSGL